MKNIELLKSNKNLVLTGAPGTGKTYLAKKIAKKMIGNEADKINEQYGFVQFHPSYDYTDFVEGLRPKKEKGSKELGFELKNGIFKDFCRMAGVIERLKFAGEKIDEKSIKQFLIGENNKTVKLWIEWIKNNEIPEKIEESTSFPKFVFVIDEINRAEISKVFGELFFSIDPGYSGVDGIVKTQYANMQTEETFFTNESDDYFFVPSNVYVIATMNDIDRSVESFDFAMRRRFAWKEIKANDRINMIDEEFEKHPKWQKEKGLMGKLLKDAKEKMGKLNDAIYTDSNNGIDGLNNSYHIGPAYFLKLLYYVDENDPMQCLWDNHLAVLLGEYLRGMPKTEENIQNLEAAYNLRSGDKIGE